MLRLLSGCLKCELKRLERETENKNQNFLIKIVFAGDRKSWSFKIKYLRGRELKLTNIKAISIFVSLNDEE